jgi:hypothetical protein
VIAKGEDVVKPFFPDEDREWVCQRLNGCFYFADVNNQTGWHIVSETPQPAKQDERRQERLIAACAAMQGFISNGEEFFAEKALKHADALLAALDKGEK